MEPDEVKNVRRANDECEEALLRVVGVLRDPYLPEHESAKLRDIADGIRSVSIKIGNLCAVYDSGQRQR
jgi:hypothetical protein